MNLYPRYGYNNCICYCLECYVRCQGAVLRAHSESQQTMRVIKQSEWGALSWHRYVLRTQNSELRNLFNIIHVFMCAITLPYLNTLGVLNT